jgi:hypothetical protein
MAFFAYTPHEMPFHATISRKVLRSFADETAIKKTSISAGFSVAKTATVD